MKHNIKLIAAICTVALTCTGCTKQADKNQPEESNRTQRTEASESNGSKHDASDSSEYIASDNSIDTSTLSHSASMAGQVVTVADIKEKYTDVSNDIMPLYNVANDEEFTFNFHSDLSALPSNNAVTVHTDPHCTEESQIYVYELIDSSKQGSIVTVKPLDNILATDSEEKDSLDNDHETWGNAGIYYLCIRYDTEADNLVKLDDPTVIPFTVRHETPAPNVKGEVDASGRFKLTWEPVEGATEYRIYNLVNSNTWTGKNNEAISGAAAGYKNASLISIDTTNECEYDDFSGKGEHSVAVLERHTDKTPYTIGQNYSVNGEYAVSAIVNGKEGALSTTIPTADLKLPYKVTDDNDIMFKEFTDEAQLPLTLDVLNIDGSITKRKVLYTYQTHTTYLDTQAPEYGYQIEGTAITGCVGLYSEDLNKVWKETVGEITPIGTSAPENNIPAVPDNDVETIIPVTLEQPDGNNLSEIPNQPDDNGTMNPANTPSNGEGGSASSLIEQQKENTTSHIENGNNASITMNDSDIMLFADSAAEEWMARNMAAGNTSFSVEAFPELQVSSNLFDTFDKVYYQNPYILGVLNIAYDYKTFTVSINYCYDAQVIAKKQQELAEAAKKISDSILTPDMNDDVIRETIYKYLEDNCSYDNAALENAEKNNFKKTDTTYEDSFNAYGIIVNKVGVCQSYALAYKLLCQMNQVECRVMTGYLNGNLPHAWNIVKIDDQWYHVDATNNGKTTGIPYFMYNCDDELAQKTGFICDKAFEIDDAISSYSTDNDQQEYYYVHHMFATDLDSYMSILDQTINASDSIICIRYNSDDFDEKKFVQEVREVYNMHGMESKLNNLTYLFTSGYILLEQK